MNKEIKVGDYIRTDDGIKQIVKINTGIDKTYSGEFILDRKYKNSKSISRKNIINASPNIINLVEENDYVNGHLVVGVRGDYIVTEVATYDGTLIYYNNEIEDVATKEQFERIIYRVEE